MLNSIGLANPGRERVPRRDPAEARRARAPDLGLGRRLCCAASTPTPAVRSTGGTTSRASSSTSRARTSTRRRSRPPRSSPPAGARPALPLYAKLSPAVPDVGALARAVEEAGADGLSLVNTIRGLALDEGLRPVLGRRPAATRGRHSSRSRSRPCTLLSAPRSCRSSGMGGVSTGRDALELIGAGASAVALGTVLFSDPDAPQRVREELGCRARAARVRIAGRGARGRSSRRGDAERLTRQARVSNFPARQNRC